ncbi:hypothetical protein EVG20_g7476 [Dentipellis fragilis]|uniref:Uncharacterized protein n=1 Tax=Dentipellis fragilis TaxID=205917 RepID=A0A4Y9YDJ0_9AGAM|nr:hypothetical protein EVG20_g7476 [Dentipellis fragilis]
MGRPSRGGIRMMMPARTRPLSHSDTGKGAAGRDGGTHQMQECASDAAAVCMRACVRTRAGISLGTQVGDSDSDWSLENVGAGVVMGRPLQSQ